MTGLWRKIILFPVLAFVVANRRHIKCGKREHGPEMNRARRHVEGVATMAHMNSFYKGPTTFAMATKI